VVRSGQSSRQSAVVQAEAIIASSVNEFMHWMDSRRTVPVIRSLRDHGERLRRNELDKASKSLLRGDDPQVVLDALSRALMNKLMHEPCHALNQAPDNEREHLARLVSRLYNLHGD
jgi:glutamyl-tRNA reductase